MHVIGITGSYGSGKTTVAVMFRQLGAEVIDADQIARQVLKPGSRQAKDTVRVFGKGITDRRGNIDRRKLAAVVFRDERKRRRLNAIVHPPVIRQIKKTLATFRRSKNKKAVVIDAPLLIEAGLDRLVDPLIVVRASRDQQIRRIQQKSRLSKASIQRRIRSQLSIREKMRRADIVIDNRGSKQQTKKQVKQIWQRILRRQ